MSDIISKDQVVAWLGEIVAEMGPETQYYDLKLAAGYNGGGTCYYVHRVPGNVVDSFEPGCIIGQMVVKKLGVPALDIYTSNEYEGDDGDDGENVNSLAASEFADWLDRKYDIRFTTSAITAMRTVQSRQDNGTSWGNAITDL